ncbi:MAG: LysE family translocator [Candidatus Aminicenantes bacterium]|nr:LysE family translocator [Candidatus Aminicenantes bacterium]
MLILVGLLIGFIAAIPLGPVNVFVISQTLKRDYFHGLLGGLTTALLDFLYCLVALAGFFHIRSALNSRVTTVMKGLGAIILLLLSYRLLRTAKRFVVPSSGEKVQALSPRPVLGVLLLYISSPTLYAFWLAVAGTMIGHNLLGNNAWNTVFFSLACGVGSLFWYLILVRFVAKHQNRIRQETVRKTLTLLAVALIAFAVYTIGTIFV